MGLNTKRSRIYNEIFNKESLVDLSSALAKLEKYKSDCSAGFDETVELAIRLGVDPKHSDQMVRGTVRMPAGLGKEVKVYAFVEDSKINDAINAGAAKAGLDDLIAEISSDGIHFDRCVATPGVMAELATKLGRILGRQRMMPNPKLGSVGEDIATIIKDVKSGSVEFKNDKAGIVHAPVGKLSFDSESLRSNINALCNSISELKPKVIKKSYVISATLSTSQGGGQGIELNSLFS